MVKTLTFSRDPKDPPFWPIGLTFTEQLQRLDLIAPARAKGVRFFLKETSGSRTKRAALALLLDLALREEMWRVATSHLTPKGGA